MNTSPSCLPASAVTAATTRAELRRRLVADRLALPAEAVALFSEAICGHLLAAFPQLASQVVGFCWPVKNEPDLRPALTQWMRGGGRAALPVVVEENAPLAFRAWTPETRLEADRYGIPSPVDGDWLTPQALLLPVNGVDERGYRIGYGGGYFDRTLAALSPRPLAIGVGFELARVADINPEAHDMPLDALVTEAGVRFFSA
ncbi:MAG: 5-formyltetrahydrofolate cyclo-ligase [Betaproteobacteria bacterium]|nr:5-formyltetrahydrofolate cyclo-ligase [Betaproteobacteria bacterium]